MKKYVRRSRFLSLLLVCLLFCGCGDKTTEMTDAETNSSAAETVGNSIENANMGNAETSATVGNAENEESQKIPCTDYLFVYFSGNGVNQETISFAISQDGFSWKALNNGKPVLTSKLGTKGVRDPYILRSAEGDKFYLIATDLCIAADGDWWKAQSKGSTSIVVWETEDLVNFSEPRLCKVNVDTAGCTWAPEAFYDKESDSYVVFFASRVSSDGYGKQRIYYVTTKDFVTFSEPLVWIDYPYSTIDTTVIQEGDTYYRFTKYEEESRVIVESSKALFGEWTRIESESLAAQEGVEGPCCFLLSEEDAIDGARFVLLLDQFGGSGYYMMTAKELSTGEFTKKVGYSLPKPRPRHGTVLPITAEEYERLKNNW